MKASPTRPLWLFTVFHLNLCYSSIEEEQRREVIRRCYWPLLRLAREYDLPFGIEASGYTLETAGALDPDWLKELRKLTSEGPCEFIGSSYAQIIGPLAPAAVNQANLRWGHAVYEKLLGFRPKIALINEQAYSAGLVPHYLEAGYQGVVMEWNNSARYHPEWLRVWRYLPQRVLGPQGETLPVIWNNAISFQKFQRYAHGELELAEYLDYLRGQLQVAAKAGLDGGGAFSLYGNDVEVFDFRPGRYATEGEIHGQGEWERLRELMAALRQEADFSLVTPSRVLDLLEEPQAGQRLRLESPEQPIVVKKQEKYNVTRWAITGRDDLGINTTCWRLYRALTARNDSPAEAWKILCYFWSSDFRTHITQARWQAFRRELAEAEDHWCGSAPPATQIGHPGLKPGRPAAPPAAAPVRARLKKPFKVERQGRFLTVTTPAVQLRLNCRRGLAIDALWFKGISRKPLLGTLPHGYFEDISLGADFYSGHTIIEIPGQRRLTDLNPTEPLWQEVGRAAGTALQVRALVPMGLGLVVKNLDIYLDLHRVDLSYTFKWSDPLEGTCRTGILTVIPTAFRRARLFYRTHNGGHSPETFNLAGRLVDHSEPASVLVSARQGLGATGGTIELGDGRYSLHIDFDPAQTYALPMIYYQEGNGNYFYRLFFSLAELDETRVFDEFRVLNGPASLFMEGFGEMAALGQGLANLPYATLDSQELSFGISIKGEKSREKTGSIRDKEKRKGP
ncbi:MAG: glycoside hydrolase family 57 [Thermodesulfobacteriota bacterium]